MSIALVAVSTASAEYSDAVISFSGATAQDNVVVQVGYYTTYQNPDGSQGYYFTAFRTLDAPWNSTTQKHEVLWRWVRAFDDPPSHWPAGTTYDTIPLNKNPGGGWTVLPGPPPGGGM